MAWPVTAKYFIRFRHSDTSLVPTFTFFRRTDTLANVTPPSIVELGGGTYYFEWTFANPTAPDIVFEVDGTDVIPTEEVRYVSDTISPRDHFLDEPISQVVMDVWGDTTARGLSVDELRASVGMDGDSQAGGSLQGKMGAPNDTFMRSTLFGRMHGYARVDIMGGVPHDDGTISPLGASIREVMNVLGSPTSQVPPSPTIADLIGDARADIQGNPPADLAGVIAALDTITGGSGGGSPPPISLAGLSAAVNAILAKTNVIPSDLPTSIDTLKSGSARMLGLVHENSLLDQTAHDTRNNLTSGRLRIYSSAAAAADPENNTPTAIYRITATYVQQNVSTYSMVREA